MCPLHSSETCQSYSCFCLIFNIHIHASSSLLLKGRSHGWKILFPSSALTLGFSFLVTIQWPTISWTHKRLWLEWASERSDILLTGKEPVLTPGSEGRLHDAGLGVLPPPHATLTGERYLDGGIRATGLAQTSRCSFSRQPLQPKKNRWVFNWTFISFIDLDFHSSIINENGRSSGAYIIIYQIASISSCPWGNCPGSHTQCTWDPQRTSFPSELLFRGEKVALLNPGKPGARAVWIWITSIVFPPLSGRKDETHGPSMLPTGAVSSPFLPWTHWFMLLSWGSK